MKTTALRLLGLLILLLLGLCLRPALAQTVTVAPDGSGNFRTIQEAINSLPATAAKPRTVLIKNGTYREKVYIDGKANVVLKGQSEKGVVLTYAQARDQWLCGPDAKAGDWGVATLNLRNCPDLTLETLSVVNSYGFGAAGDVTIDCPTAPDGHKTVRKTSHQMALRALPGATRLIVRHCTFRALGGDTVSPWDTEAGAYYFKDCTMEGGVDFYCPRGWAYAENCRFVCHSQEAAIWHDGSGSRDSKTVLRNCTFTGDDGFKLGRFHREAQFYLVNCQFAKNMANADIYHAASGPGPKQWGRRVYYAGCHRQGGDYAWMKDNLATAEGAPKPQDLTPAWTFGGRWNPLTGAVAAAPAAPAAPTDTIADNMLLYQRSVGGWPKALGEVKINYATRLSAGARAGLIDSKNQNDATIDNDATTREIHYLLKAYQQTHNPAYRQGAENGIRYLLKMQYANGGFPQFYPDLSGYRREITFNDDAMVRALTVLRRVARREERYAVVDPELVPLAKAAVARGVDCILKTQVVQNGRSTAWCAQYDEVSLLPAKARAFELPSLSGAESVGIVRFLMDEPATPAVKAAIEGAVAWFGQVKMTGFALKEVAAPQEKSHRDRVIVPQPGAVLWARFYELGTNRPIYVGRDSQVHYQLSEIENERRAGYIYASTWPAELIEKEYPAWQKRAEGSK
ncbi:pectate lyase [Hymenobacter convexus]|uniref:pectate lyase n=1 Tax=Hymenobacter sp. CA1UV-4 TaxID=3063782 RepID=UPI0027141571|nr:pectate lyase [Hymenobacter sp. CA1UV-4]MDO7853299.1 pectate lyase [Hymenobacter sp. CA1UV-4]